MSDHIVYNPRIRHNGAAPSDRPGSGASGRGRIRGEVGRLWPHAIDSSARGWQSYLPVRERVPHGPDGMFCRVSPLVFAIGCVIASSQAWAVADFSLSGSGDSAGVSSFNSAGNWTPAAPGGPQPGFTYETGASASAKILNTPYSTTNAPFAGDSLAIDLNGVLAVRTNNQVLTFDNAPANPWGLIMNGGVIVNAGVSTVTINGVMTVTADSVLRPAFGGRTQTVNADIGGTAGLVIRSDASSGGTVQFNSSANDFDGDVTVESGAILRMGADNAMPNDAADGNLDIDSGGTFRLNGNDTTIQGLTGAGTVDNTSGTPVRLTIQGDDDVANTSFSGAVQDGSGGGALAVSKTGDTTQTLSGTNNTYSGGTTIDEGTLVVTNDAALGTGSVGIGVDAAGTGSQAGTLGLSAIGTGADALGNELDLEGRGNDTAHLNATGGGISSVDGAITLNETTADSPAQFNFNAESGSTLSLDGTITDNSTANNTVRFGRSTGGDGDIELNTALNMAPAGTDIVQKQGSGTLTVGADITGIDQLDVDAGTVILSDDTLGISNDATTASIDVADGAVVEQDGVQAIDRSQQNGGINNDGTIDLNDQDASINWLSGTNANAVVENTAGDSTLTLGNGDGVNGKSFAGTLQENGGTLNIVKDLASTQSVGDIDTSGTLQVTGGSLTSGSVTGVGDVTASGGDLTVTGDVTQMGNVTVDSGNAVDLQGDLVSGGDLSVTGAGSSFAVAGSSDVGDVQVGAGASAGFDADGDDSTTANSIDNAGTVTSGSAVNVTTTVTNSGSMTLGGTLTTGGNVTNTGSLDLSATGAGLSVASTGTLASSGTLDVNGAASAGAVSLTDGSATFEGTLTVNGATPTVTVSGGTNDVQGNLTSGDVSVSGGSLELSGSNNIGTVDVSGGEVIVQSDNALAGGSAPTNIHAAGGQVTIKDEGVGLTVNEVFNLFGRPNGDVHIENVASADTVTNEIQAAVNLTDTDNAGAETYTITSTRGTLNLSGGITSSLTSGDRVLNLGGAGDGTVSALTFDSGPGNQLVKTGSGEWTVGSIGGSPSLALNGGGISSQGGILNLTGTADLTGDLVYEVLNGAELDVTGIGGLSADSGDQIKGTGLIDGNVIAGSGVELTPGDFGTVGSLSVSGDLNLSGTLQGASLQIDIIDNAFDLLSVGGELNIADTLVNFIVSGSLTQQAYAFAMYGDLTGNPFAPANITAPAALTDNYTLVYDYGVDKNKIAWVRDGGPTPTPAPGPLALIGLGALLWGGLRRGLAAREP